MSSGFFATKRSVYVGKGSVDRAYRALMGIMRNTGMLRKVRPRPHMLSHKYCDAVHALCTCVGELYCESYFSSCTVVSP